MSARNPSRRVSAIFNWGRIVLRSHRNVGTKGNATVRKRNTCCAADTTGRLKTPPNRITLLGTRPRGRPGDEVSARLGGRPSRGGRTGRRVLPQLEGRR